MKNHSCKILWKNGPGQSIPFMCPKSTSQPIPKDTADLSHIRANLLPYPYYITRDVKSKQSFSFGYTKINHNDVAWREYTNIINKNYQNPIHDFNTYIKNFANENANNQHKLIFKITIDPEDTKVTNNLADRTKDNYELMESYTLNISTKGRVNIKAKSYIGVGYALVTLQQLIEQDKSKNGCVIHNLPIKIIDKPNTLFRNFMLDTARSWFTPKSITDLLRAMFINKMNHFDWHITDDQSFPLSIKTYCKMFAGRSQDPMFHGMFGAFSKHQIYTDSDVNLITEIAYNYGISVIPGIDIPGHCSSLMYGSKQVTKHLGLGAFQMIFNPALRYQGSGEIKDPTIPDKSTSVTNAPEPIIGYLELTDEKLEPITTVIQKIYVEVIESFKLNDDNGKYDRRININVDEVSNRIIPDINAYTFLNKFLDMFYSNVKYNKFIIHLWVDPIIAINMQSPNKYTDNLKMKRFACQNRLVVGLWNLWPTFRVDQYNLLVQSLSEQTDYQTNGTYGLQYINYNSNIYYNGGYPGTNRSGISLNFDEGTKKIQRTFNKYWISSYPDIDYQWHPTGSGWVPNFGSIYTYNYKWDFDVPATDLTEGIELTSTIREHIKKLKLEGNYKLDSDAPLRDVTAALTSTPTGMKEIKNLEGAGLAVWSETTNEDTLYTAIFPNILGLSEVLWKYNENYGPDNLAHAVYRTYHQSLKLRLEPYNIINSLPIYSGENISRMFPQGNDMSLSREGVEDNGNIAQSYLDKTYNNYNWDIKLREVNIGNSMTFSYDGTINNDLMYNINPAQDINLDTEILNPHITHPLALSQYPLSSLFAYGVAQPIEPQPIDPIAQRVNPWLADDINLLMSDTKYYLTRLARSNFSRKTIFKNTSLHKYEKYIYTDQIDTPCEQAVFPTLQVLTSPS